jgi:hypothetical protein
MTFNMQAQLETLHIGAWPYQTYQGDPGVLFFENYDVQLAAARVYAINSGAVTLFTSIGLAGVIDGTRLDVVWMNATTPYTKPILY